jgi:hypothetical protein
MLVLKMKQVRARVWRGYTKNKTGWLPKRMSWMEPGAADDFERMSRTCEDRIEYLSIYRNTRTQIQAQRGAPGFKKRLYAPPTKSGHQFGFSLDIAIDTTLENFRKSGNSELRSAGRDLQSLQRWLKRFGFTPIKKERWHFNHLGVHETTVKKIDAVYGEQLHLDNEDVQRAMNKLLAKKLSEPLEIDGILGVESHKAALAVDEMLGLDDGGNFGAWFRRVLAGATVTIQEVS